MDVSLSQHSLSVPPDWGRSAAVPARETVKRKLDLHFGDRLFFRIVTLGAIGLIGLLIFSRRIPDVARNLGKGIVEFKKGLAGDSDKSDANPPLEPPAATKFLSDSGSKQTNDR